MSETKPAPLSVRQARRLLSDTSRVAPERVYAAESLIRNLLQRRPGRSPDGISAVSRCEYCGAANNWTLHADGDDELWACGDCHRPPGTATQGLEFRRAQAERNAAAAAEAKRVAAAAPSLQETLAAAEAKLANTQAEFAKVEAAAVVARARVEAAQVALNAAAETLHAARAKAAEDQAAALLDPSLAAGSPGRQPLKRQPLLQL